MLRTIRILLIASFVLVLIGASILFYYNYTHNDVSKPVFQSDGDTMEVPVSVTRKELCAGLRAFDNVDGEITDRIMVQNISRFVSESTFRVRYIVFDNASNYSTCERTVRYTDYVPPKFRLSKPMRFNVGETVTFMDRITAEDCIDKNISDKLLLTESNVSNTTPGNYRAVVSVTNSMGDTAVLPLTVLVQSRSPSAPVIELSEYLVYQKAGEKQEFRSYLASVTDPLAEGDVSENSVKINTKSLDRNTPGVYEVYYYYTGASGETASAILTVIVE